jgi:hypothetical protein
MIKSRSGDVKDLKAEELRPVAVIHCCRIYKTRKSLQRGTEQISPASPLDLILPRIFTNPYQHVFAGESGIASRHHHLMFIRISDSLNADHLVSNRRLSLLGQIPNIHKKLDSLETWPLTERFSITML